MSLDIDGYPLRYWIRWAPLIVWYRWLNYRHPIAEPGRCLMGATVHPLIRCPRRRVPASLWCPNHRTAMKAPT